MFYVHRGGSNRLLSPLLFLCDFAALREPKSDFFFATLPEPTKRSFPSLDFPTDLPQNVSEKITPMTENEISGIIVDSVFKIHTTLGPGLYESVYEATLAYELQQRACSVVRQRGIPVLYEDVKLNLGFRADIIVDRKVIVEVKSIEAVAPVHAKQSGHTFDSRICTSVYRKTLTWT